MLWFIVLVLFITVLALYLLKAVRYPAIVRREFDDPARVNLFFAPMLVVCFLTLAAPEEFLSRNAELAMFIICAIYQVQS